MHARYIDAGVGPRGRPDAPPGGNGMVRVLRRQRRGLAALLALSLVMTVLAVLHRGVPAAQLQLNDGGVWVTNQALRLVAHLNYPSRTLDGGVRAGSGAFDVSQHANTVVLHDTGAGKARNVDTAVLTLDDGAAVAEGVSLSQGGDVAVASDAEAGKVWVLAADRVGGFSADAQPTLDQVPGARTIVGVDGVVHVVLPDGAVRRIVDGKADPDGRIEGLADLGTAALTVVGDVLVVLDRASSMIRTTKGSVAVTAPETLVLQQPGPAHDRVLLAGPDAHLWAPLAGGTATPTATPTEEGAGTPAAPVFLGGCGYLAWAGSGAYVRDCPADADDRRQTVDTLASSSAVAFRVNRDVIVLNDLTNGAVLLVNDDMRQVDDWKTVESTVEEQQNDDTSPTESTDAPDAQRSQEQTVPEAKNDAYGVRPGRNVTLPVLENDTDADGDLLTASAKTQPAGAVVAPVRGGEALSIAVPKDASGSYAFSYTAEDGRGGRSDADVAVTVFPDSVNKAPEQKRPSQMVLGPRGEATYALLGDFRDPESDSIFLEGVDAAAGLTVKTRPDGVVTVRDDGTGGPGQKTLTVRVSDGTNAGAGTLTVTVRQEKVAPVANADHVVALKGQDVVVKPLANDIDPNGDQVRLTMVDQAAAGQTIQPDYAAGTFRFSASTAGTYRVAYQVANDSTLQSTGLVRVDVAEPAAGRPVPADDLAMLPLGGSVVVDALANDTDPAGGVLVLKSVSVPADAAVAVEIVDHGVLRLSAPAGLTAPVDVGYVVSNGTDEATGRVTVVPLPPATTVTAPAAANDRAVVRVGDIVTVPVLANDRSPSGLPLTIDPAVTIEGDAAAGDAFASRDVVRFRATKAGTVRVNYTVRDTAANFATAQIVLTVNPLEAPNTPPLPQPVVGRVLAGRTIVIGVPTDGIDPDGDSVGLVGLASAPTKGTAVATADGIEYTAPIGAAGTDTFAYEVADRFGARATATVRVGIASPNTTNQAPVAVPDDVATRPGRELSLNPVKNDMDADGDELALLADSVAATDARTSVPAAASGGLVELRTPDAEGVLRYYYGVTDGRGGAGRGVVSVKVSKDAVLKPPIAEDDLVTAAMIKEQPSVEVDVLANDSDPDGSVRDLQVATDDPGASAAGGKVTVTVTDQRQVVLYRVTDPDGNVGRAAIVVPPADSAAPYLDAAKLPVKVKAGELLTVPLADVVIVRAGHAALLTFAEKARAGAGADPTPPVKDPTTLQFRSTPEFSGLSSITFEVTDGVRADDPNGRRATLTLPIEVEAAPAVKHPPVFIPSEVTVEAGEATTVDLRQMATDVDPGDADRLRFEVGAATSGFTATRSGTTLSVSAPVAAQPGATGTASVTVTDGSTEPVAGTLALKVAASTRPLLSISPAVVNDAKAGSPSTIDLGDYITNPLAGKGPVTLVGEPTANPAGAGISVDGLRVTVTPPAGYHGQLVVSYTAQDATKTASRQVRGTIQLTVLDRPDAPTGVGAETHLSKTATVSWTAGANNGAPITNFTVKWAGDKGAGGSKPCGAVTTCLIDTLANDVTYTFRVSATNIVGESDDSSPSAPVRPDVKPDPPGTPVGTFGDKQIDVSWAAATSDGSPVSKYAVQITPGGATKEVSGTSLSWPGLTNGTAYTFKVRAHSAAPDPSDWSGDSVPVVPAGPPARPAAPSVSKDPVSALAPSATVAWTAPNGNGDSNLTYELRKVGTTTVLYSGTGTSAHVALDVSTTDQTFEVRAKNKADWSEWSPASNGVRGFQTPGAVTNLQAAATGVNNQVTISFGAADGKGAGAGELTYHWRANGVTGTFAGSGGGTVTHASAFPNGENVSVAVYAVSTVNGEVAQGASTSTTVNAYGPPVAPNVYECGGYYQRVDCSWSGGSGGGRPTTYYLEGNASGGVAESGSTQMGAGFGEYRQVRVCASQDMGGGASRAVCGNYGGANAWAAPQDLYSRGRASSYAAGWVYVNMRLERWRPGSTVECWSGSTEVTLATWRQTFSVDGDGNWGWAEAPGSFQTGYAQSELDKWNLCEQR